MVKKNDIDRTAQMMVDMVKRSKSNRETAYQRISDRIDNIKRLREENKRLDEENKMKDERIKRQREENKKQKEITKKARIFKELYPDIKTNIMEAFDKWLADGEPKPGDKNTDNDFDDFKRIFPDITANQEYHFERWKKADRPMPIEKKARKPRAPRKPKEETKPKEVKPKEETKPKPKNKEPVHIDLLDFDNHDKSLKDILSQTNMQFRKLNKATRDMFYDKDIGVIMSANSNLKKVNNKYSVSTDLNIKKGLEPKIKRALKKSILSEVEKELKGNGIKGYKQIIRNINNNTI